MLKTHRMLLLSINYVPTQKPSCQGSCHQTVESKWCHRISKQCICFKRVWQESINIKTSYKMFTCPYYIISLPYQDQPNNGLWSFFHKTSLEIFHILDNIDFIPTSSSFYLHFRFQQKNGRCIRGIWKRWRKTK